MLGLPARNIPPPPAFLTSMATTPNSTTTTPSASTPAGTASTATSTNPTDPTAIMSALQQNYTSLGKQPTGAGTGPTDIAYYAQQIAATGGLTPQNSAYWLGPTGRIASDIAKAGTTGGSAPGGTQTAQNANVAPVGSYFAPMALPAPLQAPAPPPGY